MTATLHDGEHDDHIKHPHYGDVCMVPSPDLPISSITDGWSLKDGSLHLFVRCADGVVRTMTIDTDRSKNH